MIELDHMSLGVRNLYEGAHRLREETGLDNYEGGWLGGAANRIVPLPGDFFIEIESWVAAGEPHPFAKFVVDSTADGNSWNFWCLRASSMEEMEAIAERLGTTTQVVEGGMMTADGRSLGWTMTPSTTECWAEGLPNWYFYEDERGPHPARTAVNHRRPFTGVAWMEVGGDPAVMEEHVTSEVFERLPLRFVDQPPGLYAVGIGTEDGDEVVIRGASSVPHIRNAMSTEAGGQP